MIIPAKLILRSIQHRQKGLLKENQSCSRLWYTAHSKQAWNNITAQNNTNFASPLTVRLPNYYSEFQNPNANYFQKKKKKVIKFEVHKQPLEKTNLEKTNTNHSTVTRRV